MIIWLFWNLAGFSAVSAEKPANFQNNQIIFESQYQDDDIEEIWVHIHIILSATYSECLGMHNIVINSHCSYIYEQWNAYRSSYHLTRYKQKCKYFIINGHRHYIMYMVTWEMMIIICHLHSTWYYSPLRELSKNHGDMFVISTRLILTMN